MTRRRRLILLIGLAALLLAVTAYLGVLWALPGMIVHSPNRGKTRRELGDPDAADLRERGIAEHFRVDVGPPDASLSCYLLEPQGQPRGTVLFFHGIRDRKESHIGMGRHLCSLGYRAVLVDNRGHGRSTGRYLTFGVVESRDAVQILDSLDRRGKLTRPVGAMGVSYGGAVAIQTAARDPRIRAVVSVSTFLSLEALLGGYVAYYVPVIGSLYTTGQLREALADAGEKASFDPFAADTAAAAGRTGAAILLLHGRRDEKIPPHHAEAIRDAAAGPVKLVIVEDEGHNSIMADRTGVIHTQMTEWLTRWLTKPAPASTPALP
jgi:pimeloyl-ACP methyl ester carboxylesterase